MHSILKKKWLGLRLIACFEIGVFFAFFLLVALIFQLKINYFTLSPHPFWIIVILISTQYGTNEGLLAALFATLLLLIGPLPSHTFSQDAFNYFFLIAKLPILWFVTAVILGELRLRQLREKERLQEIVTEVEKKEKSLADAYTALKRVKETLEVCVASEMQTTLMAISAFKKVQETQEKETIIHGGIELTQILVAPTQCSLFIFKDQKLECVYRQGWEISSPYTTTFLPSSPLYQAILNKKTLSIYTDAEELKQEGVAAVPLKNPTTQEILGMLKIEQIPFARLGVTTLNLLRIIGEWIASALDIPRKD